MHKLCGNANIKLMLPSLNEETGKGGRSRRRNKNNTVLVCCCVINCATVVMYNDCNRIFGFKFSLDSCLQCEDVSMEPTIQDGDLVLICPFYVRHLRLQK